MINTTGTVHIISLTGTRYHRLVQRLYCGSSYKDAVSKLFADKTINEILMYEGTNIFKILNLNNPIMMHSRYSDDFLVFSYINSMEELTNYLSVICKNSDDWFNSFDNLNTLIAEINGFLNRQPDLSARTKK